MNRWIFVGQSTIARIRGVIGTCNAWNLIDLEPDKSFDQSQLIAFESRWWLEPNTDIVRLIDTQSCDDSRCKITFSVMERESKTCKVTKRFERNIHDSIPGRWINFVIRTVINRKPPSNWKFIFFSTRLQLLQTSMLNHLSSPLVSQRTHPFEG